MSEESLTGVAANVASRREVLTKLMSGAGLLAAAGTLGCASTAGGSTAATATSATPAQNSQWDMSWMKKVDKPRKMAFDTFELADGAGPNFVGAYLHGVNQVYGGNDDKASAILILRKYAVQMALNDAIWQRLALGESTKLKDPTTGEITTRNPFINYVKGDKHTLVGPSGIDSLIKRGVVVLACHSALSGFAYMLGQKEKLSREDSRKQLFDNIVPGVYLMPTGVFAVCAAQETGAGYIAVR